MLVLSRKQQETILIGETIKITVVRIHGNTVRIGIDAPGEVRVLRGEVRERDQLASLESPSPEDGVQATLQDRVARRSAQSVQPPTSTFDGELLTAHAV